jgi:hypothetical protein
VVQEVTTASPLSTCAWRIPSTATTSIESSSSSTARPFTLPQRKVPALTPDNPVKTPVVVEKKSFLDRTDEFPTLPSALKKSPQVSVSPETSANTNNPPPPPCKAFSKLVGGDFNFLEDDDWLDGDSIDYSQVLFEDTEHFLSFTPKSTPSEPEKIIISTTTQPEQVLKAKDLLAQRLHSSKKQDIWKHTSSPKEVKAISSFNHDKDSDNLSASSGVKIKILKRPTETTAEPPVKIVEPEKPTKKFSTSKKKNNNNNKELEMKSAILELEKMKISTSKASSGKARQVKTEDSKKPDPRVTQSKPIEKIIYSSASKTLHKTNNLL